MQLPEFMTKAVGFFASADEKLTKLATEFESQLAAVKSDLKVALERIKTLTGENIDLRAQIVEKDQAIETARAEVTAKEADVEKRAHTMAAEIARKQGIPPVVPEVHTDPRTSTPDNWVDAYNAEPDPVKRAAIWAENRKKK